MRFFLLFLAGLFLLSSCEPEPLRRVATPMDLKQSNLIPLPLKMEATGSSFAILPTTSIQMDDDTLRNVAVALRGYLTAATGY
ncbi:MAG: hypothetical protein AB8G22_14920, partial [Saprospiraceae bacterium]